MSSKRQFCEISEEYDVKTTLARLAVIDINFSIQVCINSRSVKVVNQNGSVQLGEMAAEYFLGCALIRDLQGDHQLKL